MDFAGVAGGERKPQRRKAVIWIKTFLNQIFFGNALFFGIEHFRTQMSFFYQNLFHWQILWNQNFLISSFLYLFRLLNWINSVITNAPKCAGVEPVAELDRKHE